MRDAALSGPSVRKGVVAPRETGAAAPALLPGGVDSAAVTSAADLFSSALLAAAPAADIPPEHDLFGRFVGSWELDCTEYEPDGTARTRPGEWHFAWTLAGRAIQDVWIFPSRRHSEQTGEETVEYGTSFRFYDPELQAWRSTWIGPVRRRIQAFVARAVGDEIHLDGEDAEGRPLRWAFSDIQADRFHWRNEVADGEGGAWRLQQEMHVRRADGG